MGIDTEAAPRFAFGENWLVFLRQVGEERAAEAVRSLRALVGRERLDGLNFLDIGSGSGLFSLAAAMLGARVHSFDFDPHSVAATERLRQASGFDSNKWTVERGSVLDPHYVSRLGRFDVVYAWGVLHHTGDVRQAIRNAASLVGPDGLLAIAIYRRTRLCRAWTIEKRLYVSSPAWLQLVIRSLYKTARVAAEVVRGRNPVRLITGYHHNRGMSFHHDVHDWLGGYPYESMTPAEVDAIMAELGLAAVSRNVRPMHLGLLGSGCDEFVFSRPHIAKEPGGSA